MAVAGRVMAAISQRRLSVRRHPSVAGRHRPLSTNEPADGAPTRPTMMDSAAVYDGQRGGRLLAPQTAGEGRPQTAGEGRPQTAGEGRPQTAGEGWSRRLCGDRQVRTDTAAALMPLDGGGDTGSRG